VEVTADTQAILLLLSRLGQPKPHPAPFVTTNYDKLAAWLHQRGLRPGDLIQANARALIHEVPPPIADTARLEALLARGTTLALTLDSWASKGLWVIGRGDPDYPRRLKQRLRREAPPLLFGVGPRADLDRGGVAIIGSRAADAVALEFTRKLGSRCAATRQTVISGGAKGVDREALSAALESGGRAIAILPGDLERSSFDRALRGAIEAGHLTLLSPYDPDARFTVWSAMDRNKDVYALSDCGGVVSSDYDKGGTWAGAVENLKARWVPLFVRRDPRALPGNEQLLRRGGIPLLASELEDGDWAALLRAKSSEAPAPPEQPDLPI